MQLLQIIIFKYAYILKYIIHKYTVGLVFSYGFHFRKLTCIRKLNPNENFCAILYYMKIKSKRKFKIRNNAVQNFPPYGTCIKIQL